MFRSLEDFRFFPNLYMYFVNFGFIIFNKLQQKETKKANFGIHKLRNSQTSDFTNFRLHKLDFINFGVHKLWISQTLDFTDFGLHNFGLQNFLSSQSSDFTNIGFHKHRSSQTSDFTNFGLHNFGLHNFGLQNF